MSERIDIYNELSKLSYLSDDEVNKIIHVSKVKKYPAYGLTKVINVGKRKVFVKAIPIADKFAEHRFDTSNLYNLPSCYNYGMGSAGINPWRELLLYIYLSGCVISGRCMQFPLLYHYRIVHNDDNRNIFSGLRYMDITWNNNKEIKKYLTDRAHAKYKIVMFLEFIDYVGYEYLDKHPEFSESFYNQTKNVIDFLHKNGIIHNDAHFGNWLIDKKGLVYCNDFGLSLHKDFNLSKNEITFMKINKRFDYYTLIDNIRRVVYHRCNKIKTVKQHLKKLNGPDQVKYMATTDLKKLGVTVSKFEQKFITKYLTTLIKLQQWESAFLKSKNKNAELKNHGL